MVCILYLEIDARLPFPRNVPIPVFQLKPNQSRWEKAVVSSLVSLILRWPFRARPYLQALLTGFAVCIGGFLAGTLGIIVTGTVVRSLGLSQAAIISVIQQNYIQVGFAVFAVFYLWLRRDSERFVRVRWPTRSDVGWILALAVVLPFVDGGVGAVFTHIGLPNLSIAVSGQTTQSLLVAQPLLWPVAFVLLYLFAAPAEELVYRGIIHGELRSAFGPPSRVILGGLLFGVMHGLVGLLTPSVTPLGALYWGLSAIAPGLLWGYAYERTNNLLVTSTAHAISWTVPLAGWLPFT